MPKTQREIKFERFMANFTYMHPVGWVTSKSLAEIFFELENNVDEQKTPSGNSQPGNDTKDNRQLVPAP